VAWVVIALRLTITANPALTTHSASAGQSTGSQIPPADCTSSSYRPRSTTGSSIGAMLQPKNFLPVLQFFFSTKPHCRHQSMAPLRHLHLVPGADPPARKRIAEAEGVEQQARHGVILSALRTAAIGRGCVRTRFDFSWWANHRYSKHRRALQRYTRAPIAP
jgi:hypothetical protein